MTDNTKQTPEQKMVEITAEFFAARLVLSQPHRTSGTELDRARKMNDATFNFLLGGGYAPNIALMGKMRQNSDESFTAIIGQDGVLPLADKSGSYTVSGDAIKAVMSSHYSTWLQTWG